MKELPDKSVYCCVTSPPYWGLRDYGVDGQLGLEDTPELFIEKMVQVFREVKRVLKDDGTLWVNIGDSYCSTAPNSMGDPGFIKEAKLKTNNSRKMHRPQTPLGMKPKDLVGMPWMLAFALRADGWYLRSDIIWHKKNPMPESVTDRPTKAHEYIFLLSKSPKYYYDFEAICEKATGGSHGNKTHKHTSEYLKGNNKFRTKANLTSIEPTIMKNKRSVWTVPTKGYSEAHFATFPEKLIIDCIKAGTPEFVCSKCGAAREKILSKKLVPTSKAAKTCVIDDRDLNADDQDQGSNRQKDGHLGGHANKYTVEGYTDCGCGEKFVPGIVLDPFMGAATTALVARKLNRNYIGYELSKIYCNIAEKRIYNEIGLFKDL